MADEREQTVWDQFADVLRDHEDVVEYYLPRLQSLIESGVDVNATHDHGYTVFMCAAGAFNRDVRILRLLVESGADPLAVSEYGWNAFHAAVEVSGEASNEASVRSVFGYLKELGLDIELTNKQDQTPLALAVELGFGPEVRVLCELGANPNAECRFPWTVSGVSDKRKMPLLAAAARALDFDKYEKIAALLEAGADPYARDPDGYTSLELMLDQLNEAADDPRPFQRTFIDDLNSTDLVSPSRFTDRACYLEQAVPQLLAFVSDYSQRIPKLPKHRFREDVHRERLRCIALLAAHERWAVHRDP